MGTVYEAVDLVTRRPVAVKRIRAESLAFSEDDGAFERMTIANEFRTLADLRHPNIVSVLDYGFDEAGWPLIVMELLSGAATLMEASEHMDEAGQVDLILQLLRAVEYLRRHGVVHRDVKPSNVLVQNGRVKLVDFGVSFDTRRRTRFDDALQGTYAYLAPELFTGGEVTFLSDVYAVGVVAYEVFAREHPYGTPSSLMASLRPRAPRPPRCTGSHVGAVVEQMMASDPSERPTAEQALGLFVRGSADTQPPPNVVSSYLRAARFVGRDPELRELEVALQTAPRGEPSAWLLRGSSGVGKSRLMAELRTRALVAGVAVAEARCAQEARSPYVSWRTLLQQLALLAPERERDAIADFADPPAATTPAELQEDGARERVRVQSLASAKALFGSLRHPTLILLDDIQWIDEESLWILERILPFSGAPVAFCGACRTEDARSIHERLLSCRRLTLEPLDTEGVTELAESMLGVPPEEHLIRHLLRETSGNPFYIVETIHAFAERGTALAKFSVSEIPATLRGVLGSRLASLGEDTRRVLDVAAVHGRSIDPSILGELFPADVLESALHAATDVAIVEPERASWRFCHDQMRAAFLDALSAPARRKLHADLAAVLLSREEAPPGTAAMLARHFRGAENALEEWRWDVAAGREAFSLGAYEQAAELLSRALDVGVSSTFEEATGRRELAEAHIGMGRMESARVQLERAAALLARSVSARREPAAAGHGRDRAHELSRVYERLAHTRYFDNDVSGVVSASLRGYWFARRAESNAELARACANLAACFELGHENPISRAFRRRAHRLMEEATDPGARGWVLQIDGVGAAGKGHFEYAVSSLRGAEAVWTSVKNERRRQEARTLLWMTLFHADRTAEARELRTDTYELGRRAGNLQAQAWGLLGMCEHSLRSGNAAEAEAPLREAMTLRDALGRAERVWAAGLSAHVSALLEGESRAIASVEDALRLMEGTVPTAFYALDGYSGVLSAIALLGGAVKRPLVYAAFRHLAVFAAAFPIGRPRFFFHLGSSMGPVGDAASSFALRLSERSATRLRTNESGKAEDARDRGRRDRKNRRRGASSRLGD